MPDEQKKGPADASRINIHEAHEVTYWTNKLGVSEQELRDLAQEHGPYVEAIKEALGK